MGLARGWGRGGWEYLVIYLFERGGREKVKERNVETIACLS